MPCKLGPTPEIQVLRLKYTIILMKTVLNKKEIISENELELCTSRIRQSNQHACPKFVTPEIDLG